MTPFTTILYGVILLTLIVGSWYDIKTRRVRFEVWIPMVIIGGSIVTISLLQTLGAITTLGFITIFSTFLFGHYIESNGDATIDIIRNNAVYILFLPLLFMCSVIEYASLTLVPLLIIGIVFYTLGRLRLLGGADVWVLIFITMLIGIDALLIAIAAMIITAMAQLAMYIWNFKTVSWSSVFVDYKVPFIVPLTLSFVIYIVWMVLLNYGVEVYEIPMV